MAAPNLLVHVHKGDLYYVLNEEKRKSGDFVFMQAKQQLHNIFCGIKYIGPNLFGNTLPENYKLTPCVEKFFTEGLKLPKNAHIISMYFPERFTTLVMCMKDRKGKYTRALIRFNGVAYTLTYFNKSDMGMCSKDLKALIEKVTE